jgi:hypothetical protein
MAAEIAARRTVPMRALLLAAAVVAASPGLLGLAAAEARAAGCATSADCNMNGLCTGGACRCDPWWSGPRCSALRLGPAKPNSGYRTTSGAQGYSWGGSVVAGGDNTFHLIASEWTQRCGLEYWTPNSRLIRATSRHVDGPYVFAAEVLPTFYTNPQITAAPGGRLLLFAIGQECNRTADCANASHPPGAPFHYTCRYHNDMQSGISLFSSTSGPTGPWLAHGMVLNGSGSANGGGYNNSRTNPAPLAEADGTVKLIYRGGAKGYKAEYLGVATADNWNGPYQVQSPQPVLPDNLEDPFLYRDCRGGYHLLAHAIGRSVKGDVGVHAFR